jgi:microbial collagenase
VQIGSISCTGTNCTFADASSDPNGEDTIAEWRWIFGDGESSTDRNPTHTYPSAGDYPVTLTVTDDGGLTGTNARTVTVAEGGGEEG